MKTKSIKRVLRSTYPTVIFLAVLASAQIKSAQSASSPSLLQSKPKANRIARGWTSQDAAKCFSNDRIGKLDRSPSCREGDSVELTSRSEDLERKEADYERSLQ